MKIVFMGTGGIGVPALRWLLERSGHEVVGVVCQPDKPVGRKMVLTPPPTKTVAEAAGVPVFQPAVLREHTVEIVALKPDLTVVMAYGQFLPKSIRGMAPLGCINLHASLLPRWRGASPVHAVLAAGDARTGVTVMHVDREMDAGDVILTEETPILPDDTGESLHDRLAETAAVALARAVPLLVAGQAPRTPQNPAEVTACAKLDRASGRIDWNRSAGEIERTIRAYHPWPGTGTQLPDGRSLKIFPPVAVLADTGDAEPGTVLPGDPLTLSIRCGHGALRLGDVLVEGKKRMSVTEFLRGHPLTPGARLGP